MAGIHSFKCVGDNVAVALSLKTEGVLMSKKTKRTKNYRFDRLCISVIMLVFLGVMSVQIIHLRDKQEQYQIQEEELKHQLEAEQEHQQEIEKEAAYKQTQEYIEEIAKSRLGLVYRDEIIFREND